MVYKKKYRKPYIMVESPHGWCYNKFKGYTTYAVFMRKKSYIVAKLNVTWLHYSTSKPSWMEAKNIVAFSFSDFVNIEDAGLFHLSQEWSSANIDDDPSHCTRHIVWSAD
ncbi:hypothetical protein Tco_0834876 [Tanacetum coccineum]